MACKGLCKGNPKVARYVDGHKSCKVCSCFFKTEDLNCYCCGMKLKSKPRASNRKRIYYQEIEYRKRNQQ